MSLNMLVCNLLFYISVDKYDKYTKNIYVYFYVWYIYTYVYVNVKAHVNSNGYRDDATM